MQPNYKQNALERLFAGLVEHAFCVEIGVCDPALTKYLVGMLVDFVHVDRLHAIHDARGKQLTQVAEMLTALHDEPPGAGQSRRRTIHRHIGDFALFWIGLFPESLPNTRRTIGPDRMIDYVDQGKQSYAIAATLFDEDAEPPGSLLRRLSEDFEVCAHGLGRVRRGWEQRAFEGLGDGTQLLY